jgi:DNA repair protein RecN (Recombination protein N)
MLRRLRIENLVLIREAELVFGEGVNAVTGETGAGKTILAQAIGLLLGARGDAGYIGPASEEAYVEAELDLPPGILDDEELAAIADVRPESEEGLVAARRVFSDGRTRAYAWGRAVAREDLAKLVERLVAMSGQFEQRRLARPSFQLDVFDAFVGERQLRRRADLARAWRELAACRRRHDELAQSASAEADRVEELEELVAQTEGLEAGAEASLRAERERLRHTAELAAAAEAAAEALAPEHDGEGAGGLVVRAHHALESVAELAPELAEARSELTSVEVSLRETALGLRSFLAALEAEPGRLDEVEAGLERIAAAKRRFRSATYEELLAAAAEAGAELQALAGGADPLATATTALAEVNERVEKLATELRSGRTEAADPFSAAVVAQLEGLGMGGGEFLVSLSPREPGPSGVDEVRFLIRPNAGLPFAPVAETASGGELSRIALALRAVAHGAAGEPTVLFDEIDAGIGGQTAHTVAEALVRLGEAAQVVAITHLPQIASASQAHFRVEKIPGDPTHTRIERLTKRERRAELERMLGGAEFLSTLR